jgi:archaeal type IV pilus assembly protein PilA
MNLKNRLESVFGGEDRAVSPVIGVILMVAITVILAAVIATFVIDLGGNQESAPQASFSLQGDTITHQGGDGIPANQLTIQTDSESSPQWDGGGEAPVTAGDTFNVSGETPTAVVWNDPNSDQSAILAEFN